MAAAVSLTGCDTYARRQGRAYNNPSQVRPYENRQPAEAPPNNNGPMRGDEQYPTSGAGTSTGSMGTDQYPGGSTGSPAGTSSGSTGSYGGSSMGSSGSSSSTGGSTGSSGMSGTSGSRRGTTGSSSSDVQGRSRSQDSTVRPRSSDPYSSGGASDIPDTPSSDPSGYENPYGLGAAKNPGHHDAGMGASDGGTKFESDLPGQSY